MYSAFEKDYEFATRNGYEGTLQEYVAGVYSAYVEICSRCDAKPMGLDDWLLSRKTKAEWK